MPAPKTRSAGKTRPGSTGTNTNSNSNKSQQKGAPSSPKSPKKKGDRLGGGNEKKQADASFEQMASVEDETHNTNNNNNNNNKTKSSEDGQNDAGSGAAEPMMAEGSVTPVVEGMWCRAHPLERIVGVCLDDGLLVCAVCVNTEHDVHHIQRTWDLVRSNHSRMAKKVETVQFLDSFCRRHIEAVPSTSRALHDEIDEEFAALYSAIEAKRRELHDNVDARHTEIMNLVRSEEEQCQEERRQLDVLTRALRGFTTGRLCVSSDDPVGSQLTLDMVKSKISYEAFLDRTDPTLHACRAIPDALGVDLPTGDVAEAARALRWAEGSEGRQVYPPKGY